MPMNRIAEQGGHDGRVVAAFFASGGLNAGTPVAIASVPVRATAPAANARSSRIADQRLDRVRDLAAERRGVRPRPRRGRRSGTTPIAIISSAEPTNR